MEHTTNTDPLNEDLKEKKDKKNIEPTGEIKEPVKEKESSIPEVESKAEEQVKSEQKDPPESSSEDTTEGEPVVPQQAQKPVEVKQSEESAVPEEAKEVKQSEEGAVTEEQKEVEQSDEDVEGVGDAEEESVKRKKETTKKEAVGGEAVKVGHDVEKIDYEKLSREDLVKVFADVLKDVPFEKAKHLVDRIYDVYTAKHEKELEEKKANFILDGGLEQDFRPAEDPVSKEMNELLDKYKSLKADYNKQLEEQKEINLAVKQEILEEFRLLMEGQEGFDNTFRKFKQLQTRWFEVGIVPKQNLKDLWNSYNYFVDKFNDYIKINRELRALDLKKNLDLKIELCVKAEELSNDSNISNAFKVLQKLHARWREVGPVPREDKDIIWERFKAATSTVNKAHQNFQMELKDSLVTNLESKTRLCEKVEEIAAYKAKEHREWAERTNQLLAIQKEWKTIGYAPKKENNLIYARFRKACDEFFEKKAAFYSETFDQQKKNLEQKKEIVKAAEELKDNTDWRPTTEKLIELQKKWKAVGPVPRKDSDKLWKQFRSACDHFFNEKSDFFGGKNESYDDNLKEKEAIIAEMKEYSAKDKKKILSDIESFQARFNEIGFVPVEDKDRIREDFKKVQDAIISNVEMDELDKELVRFKIKLASYSGNPRAENKLNFERDKLATKLQQLKSDISVWENNIGFFKQTKSSEDTLADFNEKIKDAKSRILLLEKKIRTIDNWEDNF